MSERQIPGGPYLSGIPTVQRQIPGGPFVSGVAGAPALPTLSALTTKPGTLTSTGFTVRVTAS